MSLELLRAQAQEFIDKGFSFTIVPEGQKKSGFNWSTKPAKVDDLKNEGDNLGLLFGARSRNLICVDLDTKDKKKLDLADQILPATGMMDGRGDYLKSHRYFIVNPYKWHLGMISGEASQIGKAVRSGEVEPFWGKQAFKVERVAGADGIDFLGSSGLCVCPPSLHHSGVNRQWHGGKMGDPAVIDFDKLYNCVLELARTWGCEAVDKRLTKKVRVERDKVGKMDRVDLYLSKIPGAVSGEGGNKRTFSAMYQIAGGFDLEEEEALMAFQKYNERCIPRWEDWELRRIYNSAYASYKGEYGDKLNGDYKPKFTVEELVEKLPVEKDEAIAEVRQIKRDIAKLSSEDFAIFKVEAKKRGVDKGLVDEIVKPIREAISKEKTVDAINSGAFGYDEFERSAKAFIENIGTRIVRYNAVFYVYLKGKYLEISDEYMEKKLYDWLIKQKAISKDGVIIEYEVNKKRISEILACTRNESTIRDDIEFDSWLDGRKTEPVVSMKNGLFLIDQKKLINHNHEYFTTKQLPFNYEPSAKCPAWIKCLGEWFHAEDSRVALQSMFGYIMSGRTNLQKVFFLVGKPRGGKGTVTRVLESLIGSENTCAPSLSKLTGDFGLEPLVGKSLALIGEAQLSLRDDSSGVATLIKRLTGEDTININRKHQKALDIRPKVRLVFSANHIDSMPDQTGTLSSRFIIIPFPKTFLGAEDTTLEENLQSEISGIFNWSVEGMGRPLTEPADAIRQRKLMEHLVSDVAVFHRDVIEYVGGAVVEKSLVLDEYFDWCEENDIQPKGADQFYKELKKILECGHKRLKKGASKIQVYDGIRLRSLSRELVG